MMTQPLPSYPNQGRGGRGARRSNDTRTYRNQQPGLLPTGPRPTIPLITQQQQTGGRTVLLPQTQPTAPLMYNPATGPRAPNLFPQSYGMVPPPLAQHSLLGTTSSFPHTHNVYIPQAGTSFMPQQPINLGHLGAPQLQQSLASSVTMPPSSTSVGVGVQTTQPTTYQQQQTRKQTSAPRKSHAIKIIDPSTMSEVSVGGSSNKSSEPTNTPVSTTVHQPPPTVPIATTNVPPPPSMQAPPTTFVPPTTSGGGNDVRKDFRLQVLETVTGSDNGPAIVAELLHKQQLQQQAQQQSMQQRGVQQHPRPNAIIRNPNEVSVEKSESSSLPLANVSETAPATSKPEAPVVLPVIEASKEETKVDDSVLKVQEVASEAGEVVTSVESKETPPSKIEPPPVSATTGVEVVESSLQESVSETSGISVEKDLVGTKTSDTTTIISSTSESEQFPSKSEQKPQDVQDETPALPTSATDTTTHLDKEMVPPPQSQTTPPEPQVTTPIIDNVEKADSVQQDSLPLVTETTSSATPTPIVTIATSSTSEETVNQSDVKPIAESASQPPEQIVSQTDKLRTEKDKKRSPKTSPELARKDPAKPVEQVSSKTEKPVKPVESRGTKSDKLEKSVEAGLKPVEQMAVKTDEPVKPVEPVTPVEQVSMKTDKPVKPVESVPVKSDKPVKQVEQVSVRTDKSVKPVKSVKPAEQVFAKSGSKSEKSTKPSSSKDTKRSTVEMKEEPKKQITPAAPQQAGQRTIYDRSFLLQFKDLKICKVPPPELPNDVLIGLGGAPHLDRHDSRDYSHGGPKKQKKKISHQPTFMTEEVELRKAEKPWVRPTAAPDTDVDEAELKTQELYRKFQAILNKLTPQKFQKLAEQALELEIDSEEKLMGCIDKIFTKALQEPNFSIAYANLCKVLSPIKVDREMPDGKTKSTNFRRVLLTKCQQEFEKDKKDDEETEKMQKAIEEAETPEAKKQLQDELEVAQTQSRKRSLGNIRFIGELFKLKMLSETIMHECIVRLLKSSSDEESLECFARLITTTGKDLDHPQAKGRIDNYFNRIADIIKKGKIPARIKFMLQDVQELRNNSWTPRVRQDHQLKTLDQIRADAELEAAKEMEMVQKHMVSKPVSGAVNRRSSKQDDWQMKGDRRDKDSQRERTREQYDPKRISALFKRKGSEPPALGPQTTTLRPGAGGWNRGAIGASNTGSSAQDKEIKKPSRSSSSGSKRNEKDRDKMPGRSSTSGSKRSFHGTPDSQKELAAALHTVKQMTGNKQSPTTQATASTREPAAQSQVKAVEKKTPSPPSMDEETLKRKTCTIIDELSSNKDYQEAIECVKELRSPRLMNVFVAECINHTLEKSPESRQYAGELFVRLIREQLLSEDRFVTGLNDVLEYAEDIEVDVPRIWQYLGGILSNVVATLVVPFSIFSKIPSQLVESGKASKLVAQTLVQCRDKVKEDAELVLLWKQSKLQWTALGVNSEDLGEFLSRQGLEFLQEQRSKTQSSQEAPYLLPLTQLFGAIDTTNDEIHAWIKSNCRDILDSPEFVYHLTTAVFQAVVSGSGTSAIFNEEAFAKRADVIKNYVTGSKEHQLSVLYALQIAVTRLEHPPRLLNKIFNRLYDVDVVSEEVFFQWRDKGTEAFGKGNAVVSVKTFFEWLASTETESDDEERDGETS